MAMLIFMQFHHGEWSAENLFIFPENVTHPIISRNFEDFEMPVWRLVGASMQTGTICHVALGEK